MFGCLVPSLPNTSSGLVLGIFLGSSPTSKNVWYLEAKRTNVQPINCTRLNRISDWIVIRKPRSKIPNRPKKTSKKGVFLIFLTPTSRGYFTRVTYLQGQPHLQLVGARPVVSMIHSSLSTACFHRVLAVWCLRITSNRPKWTLVTSRVMYLSTFLCWETTNKRCKIAKINGVVASLF